MIAKTSSGVRMLDEPYGGVYVGRTFLVCGKSGSGKTTFAFQFLFQGLRQGERCLLLSTMPANDVTILAEAMGFPVAMPIDLGHLILLEYSTFIPGRSYSDQGPLPPEGYDQLREIIENNAITRIALDTILPWVAVPHQENIAERVFSFVRAFDRIGVTTLMTLPKPVSSSAFRLKRALDNVTPISIMLTPTTAPNRYLFQVTKYLGEKIQFREEYYTIEKGAGLVPAPPSDGAALQHTSPPAEAETPAAVSPPKTIPPPESKGIGSVIVPPWPTSQRATSAGETSPPSAPSPAAEAAQEAPKKPRLANIWKPDLGGSTSPPS